jgi:drug/metabolite transporter superfamily protein YnfA
MSTTSYDMVRDLALIDVGVLIHKGKTYGDSWKARGGVGAFMMLARKWDRIENIVEANNWDILGAGVQNIGDVLDDIADLRRYLLLVEAEVLSRTEVKLTGPIVDPLRGGDHDGSGPSQGYVNQDRTL